MAPGAAGQVGRGETKNKIMNPPIKKALITGGAGFIGSHLADRVINEGGDCVVLDTSKLRRSGWRPSMGIEEAVRRTVRYLQNTK